MPDAYPQFTRGGDERDEGPQAELAKRASLSRWCAIPVGHRDDVPDSRPAEPPLSEIRPQDHRQRRQSASLSQNSQQQRLDDLVGWALWLLTGLGPDLQQTHSEGRQQAQQTYQAINALQLSVFNATATFEAVMIILTHPAMGTPLHPRAIRLRAWWWEPKSAKSIPVAPHRAASLLLPDPYAPDLQGVLARFGFMAWRQEGQLPKGQLQLRPPLLMPMPGWNLERTTGLTGPRAGLGERVADLFLAFLGTAILSSTDHKVRLGRLTGLKEREPTRPWIAHMHSLAFSRRRATSLHLADPHIGFPRVSVKTLQKWDRINVLPAKRTITNRRYYTEDELAAALRLPRVQKQRRTVAYCRVSSQAQKSDLANHQSVLRDFCEKRGIQVDEWIMEIGGGLNFKRKAFLALVDAILDGQVERVVLAHQDRLARFGYQLLVHLCQIHQCELLVMNSEELSPEQEVVQDLLTITRCFSSRLSGLRNY